MSVLNDGTGSKFHGKDYGTQLTASAKERQTIYLLVPKVYVFRKQFTLTINCLTCTIFGQTFIKMFSHNDTTYDNKAFPKVYTTLYIINRLYSLPHNSF